MLYCVKVFLNEFFASDKIKIYVCQTAKPINDFH